MKRILLAITIGAAFAACGTEPRVYFASDASVGDSDGGDAAEPNPTDGGADGGGDSDTPVVREDCGDGIDNDGDELVDCEDLVDCGDAPECAPLPTEICDDGIDNDGDELADCEDDDCFADPGCGAPPAEICDDGIDNDGDELIDCEDLVDCGDLAECVGPEETCDDGIDNDGDAFVDCEDNDCFADPDCDVECPDGALPVGGGCPEIVDPVDYVFGDTLSYINALSIPPRNTDAECCFDFTGDGDIDNGLALLVGALAVIGEDLDIQATLDEALADDAITTLIEWKHWPDSPEFSIYLGTNDGDGDGEPDQAFEDRAAGDGIFQIKPESFGEAGALVQFNSAAISDGYLVAGPSLFRLILPLDGGGFTIDLDLTLEQARIEGSIREMETGIESVNPEFDIDGTMMEFGGLMVGGVVALDQIFSIIDEIARSCTCARIDPDEPVITYGDDGTQYAVACVQTPSGSACAADDGTICENLSLVCSILPSLPSLGLNDVDTDGNEVGDALSVGLRLSATGAALGHPAIAPGE